MRFSTKMLILGFVALGTASAAADQMEAQNACAKAIASAAGIEASTLEAVETVPKDGRWLEVNAKEAGSGQEWTCKASAEGEVKDMSVNRK